MQGHHVHPGGQILLGGEPGAQSLAAGNHVCLVWWGVLNIVWWGVLNCSVFHGNKCFVVQLPGNQHKQHSPFRMVGHNQHSPFCMVVNQVLRVLNIIWCGVLKCGVFHGNECFVCAVARQSAQTAQSISYGGAQPAQSILYGGEPGAQSFEYRMVWCFEL